MLTWKSYRPWQITTWCKVIWFLRSCWDLELGFSEFPMERRPRKVARKMRLTQNLPTVAGAWASPNTMKGATTTFPYENQESIIFISTKDTIAPTLLISLELRGGGFGRTKGFRTHTLLPSWSSSKAAGGRFHRSYPGFLTCVAFGAGMSGLLFFCLNGSCLTKPQFFWWGFPPVRQNTACRSSTCFCFIFCGRWSCPPSILGGWNFPTKWLQFDKEAPICRRQGSKL